MKRIISGIMMTLSLISMFTLALACASSTYNITATYSVYY
jgi:hypothetical protein